MDFTEKKSELNKLIEKEISSLDFEAKEKNTYKVLVIPSAREDLANQMKLFGIKCSIPIENFNRRISIPEEPYMLKFKLTEETNISPNEARKREDELGNGLSTEEGIAIAYQRSNLLEGRSIDLIGSKYKNECTPTIYRWNEELRLSAICSDVADPMCGPAYSIEKKII